MKKLRIESHDHIFEGFAMYIPLKNKIIYLRDLDKFPRLKRKIINHELEHHKKSFNYFHHLKIDFIDYWKLSFDKEYYSFIEHLSKNNKKELSDYKGNKLLLYLSGIIYNLINLIYVFLLYIIKIPIRIYFRNKSK